MPDWAHKLGEILDPLRGDHPGLSTEMRLPDDFPGFEGREERSVPFLYEADRERYLAFLSSISIVAALPADERAEVMRRVGEVVPDGTFAVRYRTLAMLSRRRG